VYLSGVVPGRFGKGRKPTGKPALVTASRAENTDDGQPGSAVELLRSEATDRREPHGMCDTGLVG
jgi:hypothetical protein